MLYKFCDSLVHNVFGFFKDMCGTGGGGVQNVKSWGLA